MHPIRVHLVNFLKTIKNVLYSMVVFMPQLTSATLSVNQPTLRDVVNSPSSSGPVTPFTLFSRDQKKRSELLFNILILITWTWK